MARTTTPTIDVIKTRKKLNQNQHDFWSKFGVTQSAGSRYESGRPLPPPIAKLVVIAHGTERQRAKVLNELNPSERGG